MINAIVLGLYTSLVSLNVGLGMMDQELGMKQHEAIQAVEVANVETTENETVELDVFYMYSNDEGSYFLDPAAEFENVIFVGYDALKEWNIDKDSLHHGQRYVGTFDSEGWELFGLEYTNDIEDIEADAVKF